MGQQEPVQCLLVMFGADILAPLEHTGLKETHLNKNSYTIKAAYPILPFYDLGEIRICVHFVWKGIAF